MPATRHYVRRYVATHGGGDSASSSALYLGEAENLSDLDSASTARTNLGLGNVNNTTDAAKPISTATQTALDGKQTLDSDLTAIAALSPTNDDVIQRKAGAWTNRSMSQVKADMSLSKTDVGLANVDNTSDANKPVSTAQATALDAKVDVAGDTMTGPLAVNANSSGAYSGSFLNAHAGGHGIQMQLNTPTNNAFASTAFGDSDHSYLMDARGKMAWGTGLAARDTFLYRDAVNSLKTDGALHVGGVVLLGGDATIYRSAAATITTDSVVTQFANKAAPAFDITQVHATGLGVSVALTTPTNAAFRSIAASGDSQHRFIFDGNGKMLWGSGAGAQDTNLYRSAADALKTDDSLEVAGTLTVGGTLRGIEWTASEMGFLTWAYDVSAAAGAASALATAGTVYTIRLHNPVARNITNIVTYLSAAGSVLTSGQCFAALFRADTGALLGTTADQSSAWASSGLKTMAIAGGAVAAPATDLIVGLWFNGTVGPAPYRTSGVALCNGALAAAASRWGTADTGKTTTAPSPLGTIAAANVAYWAALS